MIRTLSKAALAAFTVLALGAGGMTSAMASIQSAGPNPFPTGSGFDLSVAPGAICVTPTECTHNVFIQNLQPVSSTSIPGGFMEKLTATFFASFVDPNTNAPTGSLTAALAPGTFFEVNITGGFDPLNNPTGTFPETLVAASFAGTDTNGNVITATLTGTPSTGSVTISQNNVPPGGFTITNGFTVFAASTVNGNPVTVPTISATNTPVPSVPEPATLALLGTGLVGLGVLRRRRADRS